MLFITQDIDKGGMSYVMLNIALFDTLGRHFRLFFGDGGVKGIHFLPADPQILGEGQSWSHL